jgi:hypothetical protein
VDKIIESPDGHRVVCCERGREILCRLAIVASGAASGRLLEYEVGGPPVCVQTAYGVEVEVQRLKKLLLSTHLFYPPFRNLHKISLLILVLENDQHCIWVLVISSFRMI